jgi:S1-C subfamily serine protease
MSLSSAQITGNFLRRKAPLSKIKAIVVPKLSNKTGQRVQAARLLSQFYGSKLHNKNLSVPHHNSYGEGLSRRRSAAHLMAVSYAESNPSRQNNDVSVDNLKVSQIKKVLDAGNVDYRDCLERRELVDRLKETQDFIPLSAQRLLQWYLQGFDDDAVSPISTAVDLNTTVSPVEGWWLEAERNTVKVFQESSPSVANITTSRLANVGLSMNPVEIPRGTGSAFVWDKEGHIVTNYHVVMDGNRARITLSDASTWDGEVVGVAKNKDLAVLKIKAPSAKLKPIAVGTSQALQVGQHVLAIGNPFGLDRTLTSGIISGVGRDIRSIGGAMIRGVIQTDASINPGNSGGPLLDSQGRLIGVNTAIYSPSGASAGVGFAIPVDTVRRVVNQIIRQGKVVRPGLGIICANDSQAKQLGVTGVLVLGVSENSAAARAGLIATKRDDFGRLVLGDIVVAVNGQTLSNVEDLMAAFDERQIGERVRITVKRGTSVRDVYITLEEITE